MDSSLMATAQLEVALARALVGLAAGAGSREPRYCWRVVAPLAVLPWFVDVALRWRGGWFVSTVSLTPRVIVVSAGG